MFLPRRRLQFSALATGLVALASVGLTSTAGNAAPNAATLTARAEAQFDGVSNAAVGVKSLGVFRNGTENVIMLPAERAHERRQVRAKAEAAVTGALVDVRVSQFTTARLNHLGNVLPSRQGSKIPLRYSFGADYRADLDRFLVYSEAPVSVLNAVAAAYPGGNQSDPLLICGVSVLASGL